MRCANIPEIGTIKNITPSVISESDSCDKEETRNPRANTPLDGLTISRCPSSILSHLASIVSQH